MTKRTCVTIVVCLFCASFTQPAFYIDAPEKDGWSAPIGLLLLGWGGLSLGYFSGIAWLANPLFILAVIWYRGNKKKAVLAGVVALLCAGSFLFADTIPLGESGMDARIISIKAGYWIWLASIFLLAVFMLIRPPRAPVNDSGKR